LFTILNYRQVTETLFTALIYDFSIEDVINIMKKYPRNEEILKEIRLLEVNRAARISIAGASANIQRIITITARRRGIV